MHTEVKQYFEEVKSQHPGLFKDQWVLEVGSRNINGTVRDMFEGGEYVGLDWREGKGVDVVSLAHEYHPGRTFDVIVSTVMLEHDPHWRNTLHAMTRLLRLGGSMIWVWASNWPEHEVGTSPQDGYYKNLPLEDVVAAVGEVGRFHSVVGETVDKDARALFLEKEE